MPKIRLIFLFGLILIFVLYLSLSFGEVYIDPLEIFLFGLEDQNKIILLDLRLPRSLMAILVGSSMGISGAAIQGFFRNPLADPSILGISSGAMLFAVISLVLFSPINFSFLAYYITNLSAFSGAMIVMMLIYFIAKKIGSNKNNLLLVGIAISALCAGFTSFIIQISNNEQLRSVTFWSMGTLSATNWDTVYSYLPFSILPSIILMSQNKKMDVLILGETEAKSLGVNLDQLKVILILATSLQIGATVALCGTIGFIGLITPHVSRMIFGTKTSDIYIGAVLIGSLLVLFSDLLARTLFKPTELAIGIITTALGVPLFLYLLFQKKPMH